MSSFLIDDSWRALLQEELEKPYMKEMALFLEEERKKAMVWPRQEEIFNALNYCPLDFVKVVVVGQDPYHGSGQAHGLSFSVPDGVPPPPSLKNIFKELEADLGVVRKNSNLIPWARQGVLLLNAILSVRESEPLSHQKKGWETFTDQLLAKLVRQKRPLVFLLWGRYAKEKIQHLEIHATDSHLILTAAHPSPFSAAQFFGSNHFSKANEFLKKEGLKPINFSL